MPPRELRPHQVKAMDGIRQSIREGKRRPILQLPTGAGKTVCAAHIVHGAHSKGNRVTFCVPALGLVDQTVEKFVENGIDVGDIGVIQADHPWRRPAAPIQIATAQTLARRDFPICDFVVIDECFAAATMILTPRGEIPIENIQPGDKIVSATGDDAVVSVSRRLANVRRVRMSNGRFFDVTANHKIFTHNGWSPTRQLEVRARLFRPEDVRELWRHFSSADKPQNRACRSGGGHVEEIEVLLDILRKEIQQSDAGPGNTVQGFGYAEADRAQAKNPWREWSPYHGSSVEIVGDAGRRLGGGASDPDQRGASERRAPELLQGGLGEQGTDDSNRSEREYPLREQESIGRQEGCTPGEVRVESIEDTERECVVYNLHVARHPSYFANGVLVHNCHIMFEVYQKWMDDPAMAGRIFIGLTATPWAKGLGKRFDNLIKPSSLERLIEEGYASPFRVFAPSHPDLSDVKTIAGDYHEGQLGDAMSKPKLVADIVETWLAKGERRPTLCFCVNRAHAQRVHDLFEQNGVKSAYIDAFTPREDRDAIGKSLATGEIEVVVNIGTCTTGIDWDVRCIILARPTKSEMLFCQIIGRALRTAEGKDYALLLDHSDTHQRLGMVTDIDHETLDDGRGKGDVDPGEEKPKQEISLPYECKSCQCLVPPKALECPACGTKARRAVHVQQEAGELVELGAQRAKRQKDPPIHQQLQNEGKDAIMGQLRYVQSERGWSDGRTAHAFRAIFDVWPNHYKNSLLRAPSAMLLGWLRSRDIAYARAKQSERARG